MQFLKATSINKCYNLELESIKPVFAVSDKVRLKTVCSGTEIT